MPSGRRQQTSPPRRLRRTIGLRFVASLLVVPAVLSIASSPGSLTANWQSRVTPRVLETIDAKAPSTTALKSSSAAARFDAKKRLQIDVAYDCAIDAPEAALKAAGMSIGSTVHVLPMCVVEGWAIPSTLPAIASIADIKRVDLPRYAKAPGPLQSRLHSKAQSRATPRTAAGGQVIDGNGIAIMEADKYIAQTSVNGAGITVAIVNSDATNLSVIQGRGELPAVNVVQPGAKPTPPSSPSDEGTMMLEEVYAVAPGANLAFCGPQTYVEYVACVNALIAAKVDIISDDLQFPGLDIMTAPAQNEDTQAIQSLLTANPNVMLFSSAENDAANYWQGNYAPVQLGNGSTLSCQGQTDQYFEAFTSSSVVNEWQLQGQNESASTLLLAWPSTGGNNTSNYDLYVIDPTSGNVIACAAGSSTATGSSTNFTSGGTTYDVIPDSALTSLSSGNTYDIVIGTPDASLTNGYLKLIGAGDGADKWSSITTGSTTSPQDFATGAYPIGAVDGSDGVGDNIEYFSATGPIQFELPTASTLQAPLVVAPDMIYVDNAGTDFSTSIFGGTSAASPNSAAVAALLLSAFPTLNAAQTIQAMEKGATPLPAGTTTVPNGTYGYGRVDAINALAAIPAPGFAALSPVSIVGGTSATIPLTLTGAGNLTLTISSDTTTLVGASGATLSPSTCGAPTLTCSLVLTPTLGQTGTANITLTAVDGAKRSATASFAATVTKPAAPTVSITAGGSQTFTEGAATTPVTFTVAGTQALTVTAVSSNTTLLPASGVVLSTGCGGAAALSCTATLSVASGQSGTSTLAISVTDPYGQTGSASATVTVNAPSSGGGGSIDLGALLGIATLVFATIVGRRRARR